MKLYSHYRSSASYRVRIALNLKGVEAETVPVDLGKREQKAESYLALNPQGLVPSLDIGGAVLTQSFAILEWLEETYPKPPLLPPDPVARARVRAMAALLGADIHPLQNRRVLAHLKHEYNVPQEELFAWPRYWTAQGLGALEQLIARDGPSPRRSGYGRAGGGRFAFGAAPTMADVYLVPQLYNARLYELDLSPFPRILAVEEACSAIWAFQAAHPDNQPDAPKA